MACALVFKNGEPFILSIKSSKLGEQKITRVDRDILAVFGLNSDLTAPAAANRQ